MIQSCSITNNNTGHSFDKKTKTKQDYEDENIMFQEIQVFGSILYCGSYKSITQMKQLFSNWEIVSSFFFLQL